MKQNQKKNKVSVYLQLAKINVKVKALVKFLWIYELINCDPPPPHHDNEYIHISFFSFSDFSYDIAKLLAPCYGY